MEEQYEEQYAVKSNHEKPDYKNMLLPMALYLLFGANGHRKIESEDMIRTTQIVKSVKPYFQDKPREVLAKAENILELLNALNRYGQEEYKSEGYYIEEPVSNRPIKVLEAVRPHLKGKSKDKVERMLLLNDRINRLKNSSRGRRNIIEDAENITDILEALQHEKGREMRELLNKTKEIVKIINR